MRETTCNRRATGTVVAFHDLDDFMSSDKIADVKHIFGEFDPLVVGNGLSGREWSARPGN